MGLDESTQTIADALKPVQQQPSARWRWGTVKAVSEYGTMTVEVGGTELIGIRAAQHCMGAPVGDRVRVAYYGTEAMVDAVRASSALMSVPSPSMDADTQAAWLDALGAPFLRFSEVVTATQSISSGSIGYFDVEAPIYTGYTLKGAIQAWASGSGNVVIGASFRSAADNHMHFVVRANNTASVAVKALLLYTLDAITS